jgi:hypothetical protein
VLVVTLLSGLIAWVLLTANSLPYLPTSTITDRAPGWGLPLATLALLALVGCCVVLLRERDAVASVAPEAATPVGYMPAALAGAALVSIGALLWGVGFFALSWASTGCATAPLSLNHVTVDACSALDAGDVLAYEPLPGPAFVANPLANSTLAIYELLLGGGLIVLVVIWQAVTLRRQVSHVGLRWVAVWLAAASLVAALAVRGVALVIALRPNVSSAGAVGVWHADMGLLFGVLGLILAWVGLALLSALGVAVNAAPSVVPEVTPARG